VHCPPTPLASPKHIAEMHGLLTMWGQSLRSQHSATQFPLQQICPAAPHETRSTFGGLEQTPSEQMSSVQGFPSLQSFGRWTQRPRSQVSIVQALPSSHAAAEQHSPQTPPQQTPLTPAHGSPSGITVRDGQAVPSPGQNAAR
jgi:hypothetical protein